MNGFNKKHSGIFGLKIVISILMVFFVYKGVANGQTMQNIPSDNTDLHQWVEQHFDKGQVPPFSFLYGGKNSNSFIKNWQFSTENVNSTESNAEETVYTYSDKKSGLIVKCMVACFNDFQAVEWVLRFSSNSSSNTPIIEKVAAVDYSFSSGSKEHLCFIVRKQVTP